MSNSGGRMGLLDDVEVLVVDRIWKRGEKAWSIHLQLPAEPVTLPAVLSGMIDTKVRVELGALEIDPALIVNVKHVKHRFVLVVETCYESQNGIGPYVTGMVNSLVRLTIRKPGEKPQPAVGVQVPPVEDRASKDQLKGLHVLFQNHRFQEFMKQRFNQQGGDIVQMTPELCKVAFKSMAGVDSCKQLAEDTVKWWLAEFNTWLPSSRRAA